MDIMYIESNDIRTPQKQNNQNLYARESVLHFSHHALALFHSFRTRPYTHCNGINLKYSFLSSIVTCWLAILFVANLPKQRNFIDDNIISHTNSLDWIKQLCMCVCVNDCFMLGCPLVFANTRFLLIRIHTIRHLTKYYWWCKWLQLAHLYFIHKYFKWFALILHCSCIASPSMILTRHRRNTNCSNRFKETEKKRNNQQKKTKTCVTLSEMADFNVQFISIVKWHKKMMNLCQLNHDAHTTFAHQR